MTELKIGSKAPGFTLPTGDDGTVSLTNFEGTNLVLYFYPKDDTPGCTKEACDFRDNLTAFKKLKTKIIGISKDTPVKHKKFAAKYNLPFPLASDEDGETCTAYGAWVKKSMYGRTYMGINRSTFLIDGKGVIRRIWRKVSVTGHVDDVIEAVKSLK